LTEHLATRGSVALAATLAIQIYTALAASATAVLAPVIAREYQLAPNLVGAFIGLVYLGSMLSSLVSGPLIARHGPIRLSQICVLLCALGTVMLPLAAFVPITAAWLVVAALVIGAGYGPITPASSQVLARTAPPSRLALTFSIKQTGVPAGFALGGAILPALALSIGWRWALALLAVSGLFVAIAAQPIRSDLDRARDRTRRPFSFGGLFAPVRRVLAAPNLRELTMLAFFYAALQVSLTSFLVVYVTESLGRSLVAAGLALTVATVAGVAGRIVWGLVADRTSSPRLVLGGLGLAAGACAFAIAGYPADGSMFLLLALCAAFGATAIGWNGVQLAELARQAPPGEAAAVTGAANFVGFGGVMLGPPLFGLLASVTGSYGAGFATMGAAAFAIGARTLLLARRGPH
jgi:MFS family permease